MAAVLDIGPPLVAWIEARAPGLADKVQPWQAAPPTVGPYCTYARVGKRNWRHLRAPTGVHVVRVQLDFWSQDQHEAETLAGTVQGSRADPGLNGFRGDMGGVRVQGAFLEDDADEYEDPADGSEAGWFRVRQDYTIVFEEGN